MKYLNNKETVFKFGMMNVANVNNKWMEKERIKMNIRKLIAGVVCLAAPSGLLTGCGSASSTADNEEKVTVWA
ncbi:ABC transporter substrate-binding protein, partial [Enterococcus faecium]